MSILESLELALKNIVSSKVRTLLTMLGIIIGVAAVIVIVGLGNGLEGYVTESFSDMGTNTLTVTVMSRGSTRSLDVEDMYDIVEENSEYLDLCSPTVTMAGYVKIGSETVDTTTSTGVSEDYLDIARLTIALGRNLQYSDMSTRAKVCVIGAYLNQAYFGGNAVGQTLRVGGQSLEIVGVLAQQDEELEEGGSDDCLYLPYTTAERITGETSTYTITMKDENYIDESVAALEAALYAVFASDDYYTVTSMSEMLEVVALGVRSGLSFDRSLQLYTGHFDDGLARECAAAQRSWEAGLATRQDALRALAQGYDNPLFSRTVSAIIRSLRFGTSLGEVLEQSAEQARAARKAQVEERVAKAPVKMMIPTGTLILPAMLLLVLGPVLLELMEGM